MPTLKIHRSAVALYRTISDLRGLEVLWKVVWTEVTREVNGNPLQCSCLENPRDWGAWWAAIYGFAQSWTRLSSSSKSKLQTPHKYSPSMNSLTFHHWARPPLIENSVFWDSLPRGKNSKYHIGCLYIEYQNVSLIFHKNPESIFQKIPSTMDHDDLLKGIWNYSREFKSWMPLLTLHNLQPVIELNFKLSPFFLLLKQCSQIEIHSNVIIRNQWLSSC